VTIKRTLKKKVAQYTLEINPWLTRLSFEANEYLIKCPHQGDLVNYCQKCYAY
jgi:hypothetical protein